MKPSEPAPLPVEAASTLDWIPVVAVAAVVILGTLFHLFGRGRTSAEARAGLILGLRGLLGKELRSRSRGWRPMLLLTGYLAALTLAVAGFLALMARVGGVVSPTLGTMLFSALALGSVLLLAFITPALTAGAVSGERERRTLDLLLVTRASALGLVTGKLLGALFYILFLLVASLPAFALVYLFGGVPPLHFMMVVVVAAVTGVTYAAVGLLLSALLRRTLVASVLAYLLVLALVFGMPFVSAVLALASQVRGDPSQSPGGPPVFLYASPMASLTSVLPAGSGSGSATPADLLLPLLTGGRYGFPGQTMAVTSSGVTTSVYVVGSNPTTGQPVTVIAWAPWVYNFLFSGALTLLCLLGATLALAPVKPWRAWRVRRKRVMSYE